MNQKPGANASLLCPRGIITDWYDGAVAGFLDEGPGTGAHAFHMVAWDDRMESRIYVLQPLAETTLEMLTAELGTGRNVPSPGWWGTPDVDAHAASLIERVWQSAGPPEYVVAADREPNPPTAVRRLSGEEERSRVSGWLRTTPSDSDGVSYSDVPFEQWLTLFE